MIRLCGRSLNEQNGVGFIGTTAVKFSSLDEASFKVDSDTSITATSPTVNRMGTVDIIITSPLGTSPVTASD